MLNKNVQSFKNRDGARPKKELGSAAEELGSSRQNGLKVAVLGLLEPKAGGSAAEELVSSRQAAA